MQGTERGKRQGECLGYSEHSEHSEHSADCWNAVYSRVSGPPRRGWLERRTRSVCRAQGRPAADLDLAGPDKTRTAQSGPGGSKGGLSAIFDFSFLALSKMSPSPPSKYIKVNAQHPSCKLTLNNTPCSTIYSEPW